MMKYNGWYWTLLSPMIRRSLRTRYSDTLADYALRNGKQHYRRILSEADDLGPGNPMACNAYFAYVFIAVWLGTGKLISPDGMANVMTDVLHQMKPFFGLVNLNTHRGSRHWYRSMKKYEAWQQENLEKYPASWKVCFDEGLHRDGSYYYFTQCPVCSYCRRAGIPQIMSALCATDRLMFRFQHGVLHREHTLADGDDRCDYWVHGDRIRDPK